ncbi:MAG: hypothetical protein PUK86_09640 [bacterium]|nr:hypothetical protein [bacterium]
MKGGGSKGPPLSLSKKVLTSWWTGKRFFLWKMGFTKIAPCSRCAFALPELATPTVNPRRIRELESMVTEFSARTGGSKWVQALPAQRNQPLQLWRLVSCSVRRQQVAVGTADRPGG